MEKNDGLIGQSAVQTRDQELPRIRSVFEDMLSPDTMSGTETRKYGCPLFYINYLISPRSDHDGDDVSDLLFENFDNRTFIKTEATSLAESAAKLNMVGAKTSSTGAHLPEPVSLQASRDSKRVGTTTTNGGWRSKPFQPYYSRKFGRKMWLMHGLKLLQQIDSVEQMSKSGL